MVTSQELTKEEISSLKEIQDNYNKLKNDLGYISIKKMELEMEENMLKQQYSQIVDKETKLAQSLQEKYGEGKISLETGTISSL